MNFLAHTLFANGDPELIVGQYCGDFVRGNRIEHFPHRVQQGIRMHRAIDQYTDAHAANLTARNAFEKPYRRFAGIITDVVYDHYLARNWRDYSDIALQDHAEIVYSALQEHDEILPSSLRRFARVVTERNMLVSYQQFEAVDVALNQISKKSTRFSVLASAAAVARDREGVLETCFQEFFPDLVRFVAKNYSNEAE